MLHKEPEYMSADCFFIEPGSDNMNDMAFTGRRDLFNPGKLAQPKKARNNT